MKRRWKYLVAKVSGRFEETADPKVQLEQAMAEAQEQHRRLVEQAASVIANQKQTELQLNRSMQELERISGSTRQALAMADDAARRGDAAKANDYNQTAEAFANRLIATEKRVDDLKNMHLQATQAAQQAKAAVQQNANLLQQKLAERQKLLSQLDQARMQEQLNTRHGHPFSDGRPGRAHFRRGTDEDRSAVRQSARYGRAVQPGSRGADARDRASSR